MHLDWQNTTACLPHSRSAQPSSLLPRLELAPRLAQGVFSAILFQYQTSFLVYEVSLGKDGTGRVQRVLPKSRWLSRGNDFIAKTFWFFTKCDNKIITSALLLSAAAPGCSFGFFFLASE